MLKLYTAIIICLFSCAYGAIFDLQSHGYEQYQDIIVNGQVYKRASLPYRYNEERYQVIRKIFKKFSRDFTVLDIGASQGYYSLRGAYEYPNSVFVLYEGNNPSYPLISNQLQTILEANHKLTNVLWLDKMIRPGDIYRLVGCEHFDVSLLLNILHWFPNDWKPMLEALRKISFLTIVEVPPIEENLESRHLKTRTNIHKYLSVIDAQVLAKIPRHTNQNLFTTMYLVKGYPAKITKPSVLHEPITNKTREVQCNFFEKTLTKTCLEPPYKTIKSSWECGINLITFLMMNGSFPDRRLLYSNLPIDEMHRDYAPNNMILQGSKFILVDKDDPYNEEGGIAFHRKYTHGVKKQMKRLLLLKNPEQVRNYFFRMMERY